MPNLYIISGCNGAGKTSLLSVIAGYRKATSGNVIVNGENLFENSTYMPHINFIYQKNFDNELTKVMKHLKQSAAYRPHFDMEYAHGLLEKFNVPLKKRLKNLSKGQQSAVSVVVGLASRCPLTIFDEAYLGMDAPTRDLFYRELLEEQARHPRMIIMSTHLISEVEHLFDEVIIVDKGKLVLSGTYDNVVSSGVSITGIKSDVEKFSEGENILSERSLGEMKEVVLGRILSREDILRVQDLNLETGQMNLQDLFIQLTGGEN